MASDARHSDFIVFTVYNSLGYTTFLESFPLGILLAFRDFRGQPSQPLPIQFCMKIKGDLNMPLTAGLLQAVWFVVASAPELFHYQTPRSPAHQAALRPKLALLLTVLLSSVGGLPDVAFSQKISADQTSAELAAAIDPLIAQHRGQTAILIRHLKSGAEFAHQPDVAMPACSLIKLPIMLTAYDLAQQGKLDLKQRVTFRNSDRTPGSGVLSQHFSEGLELSLRDCLRLMIAFSDNTATNLVLREVGLNTVNTWLQQHQLGETHIFAQVYRPESSINPAESERWGLARTTAREMVQMFELLKQHESHTSELCDAMLEHLHASTDRQRLGRLIPENPRIALKTGAVASARHVAGIIESPSGPILICVLTANNKDRSWSEENSAYTLAQQIAGIAWRVFTPAAGQSRLLKADGKLQLQSQGELVADLQRTLNQQLRLALPLVVDGTFGPATTAAVKQFQERSGLPSTGIMDVGTWEKLGPISPESGDVVVSKSTNSTQNSNTQNSNTQDSNTQDSKPKLPADPLEGPPIVSSRSWVLGDPRTGNIFAQQDGSTARDFASTTKIMTAYVVLRAQAELPQLLQQEVDFPQAAALTTGSSATIRWGERITVDQLLYGLMLPSGNDAAVALAMHVGHQLPLPINSTLRLPPSGSRDDSQALAVFVERMNKTARELKLNETSYRNPHGLTEPQHQSSAQDQFLLTSQAMQIPEFRKLVVSREYVATVKGPGGYQRQILWRNTNRLLDQEGFYGVKTGTTSAAGACLVSLAERQGEQVLAVVLGSATSEGRYVDTRNLIRWYWQQQDRPHSVQSPNSTSNPTQDK